MYFQSSKTYMYHLTSLEGQKCIFKVYKFEDPDAFNSINYSQSNAVLIRCL